MGIAIRQCKAAHVGERSAPGGVGIHYLSLRAREREDVEKVEGRCQGGRSFIVSPAREGLGARYAPTLRG